MEEPEEIKPKKKKTPATRQDSLAVLNSQLALNKFYERELKAGKITKKSFDYHGEEAFYPKAKDIQSLNKDNLDFYRDAIKLREAGRNQSGPYDEYYKKFFNLNSKQVKELEYKGLGKTKASNNNKAYYRDTITPMQNLGAPFALLDARIAPQGEVEYDPIDIRYPGGKVSVYNYDPLAVTPFDLLTDDQKKLRVKRYGTDGCPRSYLDKTTPKAKSSSSSPQQTVLSKDTPQVEGVNLQPTGIQNDFKLEADIPQLRQQERIPKSYNITDIYRTPTGEGQTDYKINNPSELRDLPKENWKRKIKPNYTLGGFLKKY